MRKFTLLFLLLLAMPLRGAEVDQTARWNAAKPDPRWSISVIKAVALYKRTASRYETIQRMRPNGVPAPILFCLHYRESDNNFSRHAHEGSSLLHRTRDEPKGRPLHPEPPYTFEQSAFDAYYVCEKPPLDHINWRDKQAALSKLTAFNGYGYDNYHPDVPTPYLWSGTSLQRPGKYVADGKFDRNARDAQLGCVAILKAMQKQSIVISFDP